MVAGKPLGEVFDEMIFTPLGMEDTMFAVDDPALHERIAEPYPQYAKIGPYDMADPRVKVAFESGGGGLHSTLDDYSRFAQMLLNGGELDGARLLSPRSIEMMRTNHLTDVEQATYQRRGQGWGLDFSVVIDSAESGESWSTGSYYWIGIAGTWFWVDPELDLTFVGMIQHSGVSINEVQQLSRSLVYQAVVGK